MPKPTAPIDDKKRQLAQLDALIAQGVLSGEPARTARDQLERELLEIVLQPVAQGPSRALLAGIAMFVLAVGAAGYAWHGSREGLSVAPGQTGPSVAQDDGAGHADEAQIEAMVARLADRLKTSPDDAEGWAMLARSYTARGRHAEALPAYQRVVALRPKDAQALADYADGLATLNQGGLSGEPETLVMQALALDKANVKALSLAGTLAFDRADYRAAIDYWERAVAVSDPAGALSRQLKAGLDEARQHAGLPVLAAASAPVPVVGRAALGSAAIAGRVSLAGALASQARPGDTVFIFARAPGGSKMPLAILRKKVSDLPLDFQLDDSLAMSPAARLSSVPQVVVGARISRSGDAAPRPGDLQTLSAAVAVGTRDLRLEISEQVR